MVKLYFIVLPAIFSSAFILADSPPSFAKAANARTFSSHCNAGRQLLSQQPAELRSSSSTEAHLANPLGSQPAFSSLWRRLRPSILLQRFHSRNTCNPIPAGKKFGFPPMIPPKPVSVDAQSTNSYVQSFPPFIKSAKKCPARGQAQTRPALLRQGTQWQEHLAVTAMKRWQCSSQPNSTVLQAFQPQCLGLTLTPRCQ